MTGEFTTIALTAQQECCGVRVAKTRERIRWLCEQVVGQDVLAVGGLAGTVCRILAREDFRCTVINVDSRVIDAARQSLAQEIAAVRQRIAFHVQDSARLPFEETSFDTVVIDGLLPRLTHSERMLREARRILRDVGRIIITVPCGPVPAGELDRTYYPSLLLEELQPLFRTRAADLQDDYLRYIGEKDPDQRVGDPARKLDAEDYRRLLKAIESRCQRKEQALHALEIRLAMQTIRRDEQADVLARRVVELETRIVAADEQTTRFENDRRKAHDRSEALEQRLREECQANVALREQLTRASATASDAEYRLRCLQEENGRSQQELAVVRAAAEQRAEQAEALHRARLREREKHFRELLATREAEWRRSTTNRRIRELVRVCLPAAARVLVISHGDEDLLHLEGRHGAHFPQTVGGGYAGYHPSDAAEAIGHLESLKAKGAQYLLIPESSLWWLDYYGGFRAHLQRQSSLVVYQDGVCAIYALRPPTAEHPYACGMMLQADEPSTESSAAADAARKADIGEVAPATSDGQPMGDGATLAVILDEFTADCLRPECRLLPVRPGNWRKVVKGQHLDAVFVESAWSGCEGAWSNRLSHRDPDLRDALTEFTQWAREQAIPSIFWNKEDPVHFERFLEAARLFSHVFTTDADCIPQYRERLGHDRVFALPFAAQPAIHNPIQVGPRDRAVCFAGTYYGGRHQERQADMEHILRPAIPFGLDIYDRKHGSKESHGKDYRFPDIYQPCIRGSLPYDEMVRAYKRYRVFLNVNCVNHSPTMFSRRIFELLACGTPVISTYSPGIVELLGEDTVFFSDTEADTRGHLEQLLGDEEHWARASVRGIRRVLGEHTYRYRLQEVFKRVGIVVPMPPNSPLSVVVRIGEESELPELAAMLSAQTYQRFEVLLVSETPLPSQALQQFQSALPAVPLVPIVGSPDTAFPSCVRMSRGDYIALLDLRDWYGPNYLMDCQIAIAYSTADFLGKHSFYHTNDSDRLTLNRAGHEFRRVAEVPLGTLVARKTALSGTEWQQALKTGTYCTAGGECILSIDRFNFVRRVAVQNVAAGGDAEPSDRYRDACA